MENGEWRMEN